jgi:hypothetical protein
LLICNLCAKIRKEKKAAKEDMKKRRPKPPSSSPEGEGVRVKSEKRKMNQGFKGFKRILET